MISMDQFKRGAARDLDEEFTGKMVGWQKWVFGAAAAMYLENFGATVERLAQNEFVKALNLIDSAGNIDAEKLHKYFLDQARKGPITVAIPAVGSASLSEADVEKLYTYIMNR